MMHGNTKLKSPDVVSAAGLTTVFLYPTKMHISTSAKDGPWRLLLGTSSPTYYSLIHLYLVWTTECVFEKKKKLELCCVFFRLICDSSLLFSIDSFKLDVLGRTFYWSRKQKEDFSVPMFLIEKISPRPVYQRAKYMNKTFRLVDVQSLSH